MNGGLSRSFFGAIDIAYRSQTLVFMELASLKSRLEYKWPDAAALEAPGRISAKRL
jgi:hypothetical protein